MVNNIGEPLNNLLGNDFAGERQVINWPASTRNNDYFVFLLDQNSLTFSTSATHLDGCEEFSFLLVCLLGL